MLLTVSKRLEFSASRRLFLPSWSDTQNVAAFGLESGARYGTGRNYVAYFVFSGEINPGNGMLVNISEIKARVEEVLHAGFDHKFLNEDHPIFRDLPPTAENVARQLFVVDQQRAQQVALTRHLSLRAHALPWTSGMRSVTVVPSPGRLTTWGA